MPSTTSFLSLTLPELNEFVNSWHTPLNQNLETVDDYLKDLSQQLVGSTGVADLSTLKGSTASLLARLAVSIEADGTIDLSSASEIVALATSKTNDTFSDAGARFEDSDFERFDVRAPFTDGRFDVSGPVIAASSGSYPHAPMDVGMSWRGRDYSSELMSSPPRPWAPGVVYGNASLLTGGGNDTLRIQAGTTPALINIDGYMFRLREDIDLDLSAITGVTDGGYVWIFAERNESSYNNPVYQYNEGAKDLRRLQEGTDGATSGSLFTGPGGTLFQNKPLGKVKPGDLLVLSGTTSAGTYVVDSIGLDTQLTIKGTFPTSVGGNTWYILDNSHPNIGGAPVALETDVPSAVAGRVYLGRCIHNAGSSPTSVETFAFNGVYDSDWFSVTAAGLESPTSYSHKLGVHPSQVEIWLRDTLANDPAGTVYRPVVRRELTDGGSTVKYLYLPSIIHSATMTAVTVRLDNDTDGQAAALFTKTDFTDVATGEMRIIARR